jgi:hypothetical protein
MGKFVEGTTLTGWGVIRGGDNPWHFVGIYADKAEADAKAKEMGPDYEVKWGDNQEGTDNFLSSGDGSSPRA